MKLVGEGGPEKNFVQKKGTRFLVIVSALIAIGPFSMEAYLPAIPTIARDLHVGIVDVNLTVSSYLLGIALGQLLGGPISDQTGRKKNVFLGLIVFILASLGIQSSSDIEVIQILRFIQGLGGGFASVVGMPTIRDVFEPEVAARKMPLVSSVMMIAPLSAPMLGSVLLIWHWRLIFSFLILYAVVILWIYCRWVPETRTPTDRFSTRKIFAQFVAVLGHRVNRSRVGLNYILIGGFASGSFLTFLTNAPWIYLEYFQVGEFVFPLFFAIHVLVLLLTQLLVARLVRVLDPFHILQFGVGIQLISITLTCLIDWQMGVSLLGFILALALVIGAGALISAGSMAMLFAYFQRLTGSVMSLMSCIRFCIGAALGVLSGWLFDHSLLPILCTMLLSSAICLLLAWQLPRQTLVEVAREPGSGV